MKKTRQIEESKEMIASSFKDLMKNSTFSELTLSEIADHAGVNRMTIYRHFKSKEKILLYCAQKSLEEHKKQASNSFRPSQELIYQRLEWIRTLPQLPILLQSREIENLLDDFMLESHRPVLERFCGISYEEDPHIYHFYFGGVNRTIRDWLNTGCQEPAETIAKKVIYLTATFIESIRKR
ncbi:MAG: TetR/AcrR family transcriptional regulator [Spirochaetia bacterium]|nr:TetR/AcrR family transcriptional regulator [Spirochaetia bacterium]